MAIGLEIGTGLRGLPSPFIATVIGAISGLGERRVIGVWEIGGF